MKQDTQKNMTAVTEAESVLSRLCERYERYGYADAGQIYRCILMGPNRVKCFGEADADVEWIPLREDDTDALRFARTLCNEKPFHVERYGNDNERDVFRTMHAKNCRAYVARRNGAWLGYVCVGSEGKKIYEWGARGTSDFLTLICAWQAHVGETIEIRLSPDQKSELAALSRCCQDITLEAPAMFRILRWERVCNALMKLSFATGAMPKGEVLLHIEGYGTLRLFVNDDGAGCERADGQTPDMTVAWQRANGLLFGPFAPNLLGEDVPLLLRAWLPVPVTWNSLDLV
jgi:hypothetical protein